MANKLTLQTIFEAVDKLSGPAKTMSGKVGSSTSAMEKSFKALGGAMKVAVGALTAGAFTKTISDFAERGDDIARNAGILGLTAESYQELSYAANMADVDQEAFASSAKKLSKSLGEMNMKEGALYTTLSKMNPALAVQLHHAKSNDEAFSILADAISKETNAQKKAVLAQAAFGKTGQDMIPMMEGLADARKKARAAGAVMTDEEVAAASAMDDAIKGLKTSGVGLLNSTLAPIAAKLAPIIERMTAWVRANKALIGQRIDQIFAAVGKTVEILVGLWNSGLIPAVLAGIATFKILTGAIAAYRAITGIATAVQIFFNAALAANPVGLVIIGIAALVAGIVLLVKNWDKVKAVMGKVWDGMKAFGAWIASGFVSILRGAAAVLDTLLAPYKFIIDSITKLTGSKFRMPTASGLVNGLTGGDETSAASGVPISSNTTTTHRSELAVSFAGAPPGTSYAQRGYAPGITLNTGRQMVGGAR